MGQAMDSKFGPLELLVIQATPFCNIDCAYCYLPNRSSTKKLTLETVDRIFFRIFESGLVRPEQPVTVLWHAGEPLSMPVAFYEKAIELGKKYDPTGQALRHSFQTNATLLKTEWCEFFKRNSVVLGVSVDGPRFLHDRNRLTLKKEGTHQRVVDGMRLLKLHDVPFSTITVLTDFSLDYPDEIYDFFVEEGVRGAAFNIEEVDGTREQSSLQYEGVRKRYMAFLSRFFDLIHTGKHPLWVREIDGIWESLASSVKSRPKNQQVTPFGVLCFSCDGKISGFSPELLGMKNQDYDDFILGDLDSPINSVLANSNYQRIWGAIEKGVQECRKNCTYFDYCGGGAPANKFYENGRFDSTETMYCRLTAQAKVDVIREKVAARKI
jgi:uncharacterized protein